MVKVTELVQIFGEVLYITITKLHFFLFDYIRVNTELSSKYVSLVKTLNNQEI